MGQRPEHLEPGRTLSPVTVELNGAPLVLGCGTPGRNQLLLFERGHWCAACRRHLALIADEHAAFAGRHLDQVAVTHEEPGELQSRIYPYPVIADPDLQIAERFGVVRVDEFAKLTIRPTAIVATVECKILFSYVGDDSRDRPTIPALLLALDTFPSTHS